MNNAKQFRKTIEGKDQRSLQENWSCQNISCKDEHNKGQNGEDLTEAGDIKKRWQGYTEELYQKYLYDLDNHDGVVTHVELDILECEVKWALGSITTNKASGGDGIPVELFQILKDAAVRSAVLNTSADLENSAVATGLEKISFHSNPKEGQCQRMFQILYNCIHFT